MLDRELERLEETLATELYHIPPVEWNRIVFCSELSPTLPSYWYYFFPTMDNDPRQSYSLFEEFGFDKEDADNYDKGVIDALHNMIRYLYADGESPWNVLTVIVEHTGDYQFEFDKQDFSLSYPMDRREVWKAKYLADPPLKQEMDPQKKMDDLINNLGQNLVKILHYNNATPVDWHRVEFYAEVGKESNSIHYLYYPESDKQPRSIEQLIEENRVHPNAIKRHAEKLGRVVGHLLNAFTELGNEPWTTIRASIDENGKFGVNFGYEDLSQSTEEQRVAQWKASLK